MSTTSVFPLDVERKACMTAAPQAQERAGERWRLPRTLQLTSMAGEHAAPVTRIPGECLAIDDGGLRARVPIGYGVAPGQQYAFLISVGEEGPCPGLRQIVTHAGEIVQTRFVIGEHGQNDSLLVDACWLSPGPAIESLTVTAHGGD